MRSNKILWVIVIILGIFFIVSFGLSQIIANDYFKNMFWCSTALLMVGTILDLNAWSKLGLDVDKNKSRTIKRSFDDSTTLLVVFYGTLLALVVLLDSFNHNLMTNNYSIIIISKNAFFVSVIFDIYDSIGLQSDNKYNQFRVLNNVYQIIIT